MLPSSSAEKVFQKVYANYFLSNKKINKIDFVKIKILKLLLQN